LTGIFAAGLPAELIAALKLAARLHDIGKADPRFQLWLHKADRMAMLSANKLLAKSARSADWNEVRQYRELAGYPAGTRHECYSVAMARNNRILDGTDSNLVLYLIGVHHGRGRPYMPAIDDPGTTIKYELEGRQFNFSGQHHLEQIDSDWPDRFWQFCRQYGYWGIAYLETLIRLADQSQSAQERR
jgi:CRISPR-associated endonuclease/helicase Cas3